MKKIFLPLILIISLASCKVSEDPLNDTTTPDPENLEKHLIAYWSFDDETANDFSGSDLHGEIKNSDKVSFVDGVQGKAVRLIGNGDNDGSGGHITIPMINFNEYKEFTISMWVKEENLSYEHGGAFISFGDWNYGILMLANAYHQLLRDVAPRNYLFSVGSIYNDLTPPFEYVAPIYFKYNSPDFQNRWVKLTLTYIKGHCFAFINDNFVNYKKQPIVIYGEKAGIGSHWWEKGMKQAARFTSDIDEVKIYKIPIFPANFDCNEYIDK